MLESFERNRGRYDEVARSHPWMREMREGMERELEGRYMELPLDADGEPCRVGDVLDWDGGRHEVVAVGGGCVWFDTDSHELRAEPFEASGCRHARKPSVEELLVFFAIACEEAGFRGPDVTALSHGYAERLRKAVRAEWA